MNCTAALQSPHTPSNSTTGGGSSATMARTIPSDRVPDSDPGRARKTRWANGWARDSPVIHASAFAKGGIRMRQFIWAVVYASVLSLGVAGIATAQPQGNQQQKCINKINKGASKVQAAQGKANAGCIKDAVLKGTMAEPCIIDDPKDKVEGKQAKLNDDDMKNCTDTPDFGYTSGTFAGTTAYQAEVNLIHDIYGNPVDSGLYSCDTNPAECLCQRQVDGRIEKLFRAMSKIFLKCKNPALAIGK